MLENKVKVSSFPQAAPVPHTQTQVVKVVCPTPTRSLSPLSNQTPVPVPPDPIASPRCLLIWAGREVRVLPGTSPRSRHGHARGFASGELFSRAKSLPAGRLGRLFRLRQHLSKTDNNSNSKYCLPRGCVQVGSERIRTLGRADVHRRAPHSGGLGTSPGEEPDPCGCWGRADGAHWVCLSPSSLSDHHFTFYHSGLVEKLGFR